MQWCESYCVHLFYNSLITRKMERLCLCSPLSSEIPYHVFPFHPPSCLSSSHQFVENSLYSTSDILCGYLQREAQMYLTVLSLKGSSNPAVPLIYNIAMIDGLFRGGTCKNSLEECLTIIDTWWVLSCLPWSYNQRFHATVFNIADIFAMRIFLEVHAISHKP